MKKNNKDYIEKVKDEVNEWENKEPGYLTKVSDFVLYPVQKVADTLVPEVVMKTVVASVEGCLKGLFFGASYTMSKDSVLQKIKEENSELTTIQNVRNSNDLESMDKVAYHYWNWNLSYAFTQGVTTGSMGLPGLAANIPALFTIVFRMMQQISLSYGYDPDKLEEKLFILNVLSVASSADMKAKQATMLYLKQIQVQLLKKTWKKLAEEKALVFTIKEFAKKIGIQITKRKAIQMVPVIGAVIGGVFDSAFCNDVGCAAVMAYRKRKLDELA